MATDDKAQLSALIGGIYDAVLEPALWAGVVESAGRFVGGVGASIFKQNSVRKIGNSYYQFGIDPHFERLYFEKYIKFDPLSAAYLTLNVGDVSSSSNIIPPAEFFELVSIGNGRGHKVSLIMFSRYLRGLRRASLLSLSSAMNAMALLTTQRDNSWD